MVLHITLIPFVFSNVNRFLRWLCILDLIIIRIRVNQHTQAVGPRFGFKESVQISLHSKH